MYTLPLGYAARAIRAVSAGTGEIACGLSDIGVLLMALPDLFLLRFLTSLFLYRQVHWDSPVVSDVMIRTHQQVTSEICNRLSSDFLRLLRSSASIESPKAGPGPLNETICNQSMQFSTQ
jgi:hypothetical protein